MVRAADGAESDPACPCSPEGGSRRCQPRMRRDLGESGPGPGVFLPAIQRIVVRVEARRRHRGTSRSRSRSYRVQVCGVATSWSGIEEFDVVAFLAVLLGQRDPRRLGEERIPFGRSAGAMRAR